MIFITFQSHDKHVQKLEKPGFYKFSGCQKTIEWKNSEEVVRRSSVTRGSWMFRKNHRKTSALEPLFIRVIDLRCFYAISKNTYFVKHCWTTALIWWRHQKLRITFWKQFLPHRIGNDSKVKILSCDRVFCFPDGGFSVFSISNVVKLDKGNFKRDSTMAFKVKNS